jgi:DNA uptake protein ComE-like DNA-binding protein
MNSVREPIRNWFGFTRRERRSTFILLLLVVLIIAIRYLVPDSQVSLRDITGNTLKAGELSEVSIIENSFSGTSSSLDSIKASRNTLHNASRNNYRGLSKVNSKRAADNFGKLPARHQKQMTDLNLSDSSELIKLPGIGPVLSSRIIKFRHLLGGFARISQLKEVYGLPEETFNMIKDHVFADSTVVRKIDINSAGYKELSHLHYFEKYEVTAILKYRELKGRIKSIDDLTDNKLISMEKAIKVRPYLKFDE